MPQSASMRPSPCEEARIGHSPPTINLLVVRTAPLAAGDRARRWNLVQRHVAAQPHKSSRAWTSARIPRHQRRTLSGAGYKYEMM